MFGNIPTKRLFTKFGNPAPDTQQVIPYDGGYLFVSYGSPIAHRSDDGQVTLYPKWDYSSTTGEYRNQFLSEQKWATDRKIKSGEYVLAAEEPKGWDK